MTQHDSSIGGPGTQDGIAGSRSGTEGATSGQGVDKGATQRSDPGSSRSQVTKRGGMGGNSSDPRQSSGPGVMEKDPRDNALERKPGP